MKIRVEDLREKHLMRYAVWEYTPSGTRDVCVTPVKVVPVSRLLNRLVATRVVLANGQAVWATVGSASTTLARLNRHMLSLRLLRNDVWFPLARYYEKWHDKYGPEALASFLGLAVADVFPMSYDLRPFVRGTEEALVGKVLAEPEERLSMEDIFFLALQDPELPKPQRL